MTLRSRFLFALYFVAGMAIYGRSLSYNFVYDDHWRIERNAATASLSHPLRFLLDPSTQATQDELTRHTYRPLITLSFAVDRAVWGLRPFFFRFENLLLHVANAALLTILALSVFQLPVLAACLASLFFLAHPVAIESVVWISGRSDVLSLTFILLGLWSWSRYRWTGKKMPLVATYVSLALGLLTREIMLCFVPLVLILDPWLLKNRAKDAPGTAHIAAFSALSVVYFVCRSVLLGRIGQVPYWGGSFFANLANVMNVWPHYLRKLFWPAPLHVTYIELPVVTGFGSRSVMGGVVLFVLYALAVIISAFRSKRLAAALSIFLIVWLPVSNLVPIASLFNDRFVYPLLPFAALALAVAFDSVWRGGGRPRRRLVMGAATVAVIGLALLTWTNEPIWANDVALWRHAVTIERSNWITWSSLGDALAAEGMSAREPLKHGLLAEAQEAYTQALNWPSFDSTRGVILFAVAVLNVEQGRMAEARQWAEKSFRLRPDLQNQWEALLREKSPDPRSSGLPAGAHRWT